MRVREEKRIENKRNTRERRDVMRYGARNFKVMKKDKIEQKQVLETVE